jgi:hypothetical protein
MPAAELAFEVFALALEATRGTAITPPTHVMPVAGVITPVRTKYRPEEARGTLEEWYRSKTVHTGSTWEIPDSLLDPNYAPILFNMISKANSTPTTPALGVLTRLWTYTPTLTSDDIKSATLYFGDPNVQIWQSAYCMADELTVSADATTDDAVTFGLTGAGQFPTRVTAPTFPAAIPGDLLMPGAMQLWIDTASAIGTTEITGRFVKTDWTLPTGVTYKNYANGPAGGLNFTKTGRTKRHAEASIEVELNDLSIGAGKEYLTWEADTVVKMRIRLNGAAIETVAGPLTYYSYVNLDIYGALDAFEWSSVEDSNRSMRFTVQSEYNSTLGASWSLSAQSTRTTL